MNRTIEFRQLLSDITNIPDFHDPRIKPGKYSSLLTKKPKGIKSEWVNFDVNLRRLVKSISTMKLFLIKNRKDYVNLYTPLVSKVSRMKDSERDQIDYSVHVFMKESNELLRKYRNDLTQNITGCNQIKDHYLIVLDMIEVYLKSVCNIYTEAKAIRVKRACEKQRLSRLATVSSFNFDRSDFDSRSRSDSQRSVDSRNFRGNRNDQETPSSTRQTRSGSRPEDEVDRSAAVEREVTLTAEEMQIYDKENTSLYQEMNSIADEVKMIGGKVVEIARLQEIFTEKVLEQEVDLNRLNSTVIASTENIKEGNDELREAMKKSAGFRVWVLFFIITLGFTVLFLDWYNP